MKKLLSLFLAVAVIIYAVPFGAFTFTASAEEKIEYTEDYYTYKVLNGEVTITDVDAAISGDIIIPLELRGFPVSNIGVGAFADCSDITSITIHNNVTSIGMHAFYRCNNLTNISIGSGIASIGMEAFNKCENLENVYITDIAGWCNISFESYTSNPIANASNLYLNGEIITDIVIPEGVNQISDYAFCNYNNMKSVTLPKSVTRILPEAFYNCTGLRKVYYRGSETEKSNISIGWRNTYLENATWYYNACIATNNHNYGEWITEKEANCIESGLKYKVCSFCDHIITENIYETGVHCYDNPDDTTCNICGLFTGIISGTTGDCTWTLDGTKLTISGNGAMADYSNSNRSPWYDKKITEITIEDGVTSIGDCVF